MIKHCLELGEPLEDQVLNVGGRGLVAIAHCVSGSRKATNLGQEVAGRET